MHLGIKQAGQRPHRHCPTLISTLGDTLHAQKLLSICRGIVDIRFRLRATAQKSNSVSNKKRNQKNVLAKFLTILRSNFGVIFGPFGQLLFFGYFRALGTTRGIPARIFWGPRHTIASIYVK